MAKIRISLRKQALAATALVSVAIASGCSTVERTSLGELTAVQTVTPVPKPGGEMAAHALPATAGAAPEASATPAAEAATNASDGSTTVTMAESDTASKDATLAFAAPQTTAIPVAKPTQAIQVAMAGPAAASLLPEATAAADSVPGEPAAPLLGIAAAMESDFDTGEPVGLETLVAKRMIVPTERPKTGVIGSAVDAVANVIPDSLKLTKTPTSSRPELDRLIEHYAELNGLPVELVHRVVKRESNYNPRAYSKGNYGLMQIRYNTAKGLGYNGPADGLFDAETNLKYATRYLRGAWMVADNQHDGAVRLYASGYYYHAKRKGMLDQLGMR
ncbi:Soluble lytic murein transglycosylase-related regulatory protein [Sinorhizobium sojae CCBAU 05684]|uniref:Soluble lytic murein transglycosylase-related regulatory protein n=1 Tax=Sinorhizobium sojae CCBAU 05684 TaxID=716928 RepID=A0A249PD12_9HYPH|nr:lytic transglycosylase domain-containing protein [Sinorhizobium sojae]ASY63716.1 Soluble lytic murein transglycosylase-related regulatory protein [Sinorhizobium sojae CCBAU 05684]